MSTSILMLSILFILSNTFLLTPNVVIAASSFPMIERACFDYTIGNRSDLCVQLLESEPKVVSAATSLSEALAFAMLEATMAKAENTSKYIGSILKEVDSEADTLASLLDCHELLSQFAKHYHDAMGEIKGASDYQYASGDVFDSFPVLEPCKKIERWSALRDGIDGTEVIGIATYNIVGALDAQRTNNHIHIE